jgi:uncharacterized protein YuzE
VRTRDTRELGGTIRVPYRRRWSRIPAGKRLVNSAHARIRAVGEQGAVRIEGQNSAASKQQQGSPLTVADVRVTYDKTADAAYLYLTEPQARVRSARMHPCDPVGVDAMINLDFDEQGRLIGIEVLAASSKLPKYLLQSAERLDTEDS